MNALRLFLRRFASDQHGAIAISFVMVFVMMVGSTVFAIDMARYNIAQSRLQNSLDLTLISVGRNLPQYQINLDGDEGAALRQDVYDYFYANIPDGFLEANIPQGSITIDVWQGGAGDEYPDAQYIQLQASGKLPMLSTGFFDFSAMDLQASNTAIRRVRRNMEMVLALDNSSTANVGTQEVEMTPDDEALMSILRSEATDLATAVLDAGAASGSGTDDDAPAHVGLVPYTDFVNIGAIASADGWLNITPGQEVLINGYLRPNGDLVRPAWLGCVSEPIGSWSAGNPLPAKVLAPDARFQPVLTLFGHDFMPDKLEKNQAAYLVKHEASNQGPGKGDFNGGVILEHDQSGNESARVVNIWPYEKNWDYRSSAQSDRNLAEPHSFWINFAVDSVYDSDGLGLKTRTCPESKAHFLTSVLTPLTNAIHGMQQTVTVNVGKNDNQTVYGYGGGATIPVGLLWSWRMLSPEWRGASAWGSSVLPRDGDQGVRKIIVLFTKGGNQPLYTHASDGSLKHPFKLDYAYREGSKDKTVKNEQLKGGIDLTTGTHSFTQCPLNGLRTLDTTEITPPNHNVCQSDLAEIGYGDGLSVDAVNAYMEDVCQNIKNDPANIEIYTVTLGNDPGGLVQACASSPDKYFNAANVDQLSEAFKAIAANVTDFRLIK